MASQLEDAPLDLLELRSRARVDITRMLQTVRKGKVLILDKSIVGPLNLVAEMSMLKKFGAKEIFHLGVPVSAEGKHIIYLARPTVQNMRFVADQVFHDEKKRIKRKLHLFLSPRPTRVCIQALEDRNVRGSVTLRPLHLGLIPMDSDVLSMQNENIWRDVFLSGDISHLWDVAQSLMKMQLLFGLIPKIKAKGRHASTVMQLMRRLRKEADPAMYGGTPGDIEELIILDRTCDLVTPMMTQMTYEGIIDELIGIRNGCVEVNATVLNPKASASKKTLLPLNSSDVYIYKVIRDFQWKTLGVWLHNKAGEVRAQYDEAKQSDVVKSSSSSTIGQMKDVVKRLKTMSAEHNYLQTHSNLAHEIYSKVKNLTFDRKIDKEIAMVGTSENCEDFVEASIAKATTYAKAARLLCLLSQTRSVYPKRLNFFQNEIVQSFGYEYLFALENLRKTGAIVDPNRRCNWTTLRRRLGLFRTSYPLKCSGCQAALDVPYNQTRTVCSTCGARIDTRDTVPDTGYLYQGYQPLSTKLVELATAEGTWARVKDILELLPGPTEEFRQEMKSRTSAQDRKTLQERMRDQKDARKPITLVMFVGGVTYAEISALRKLGKLQNREYMVACTHLTNGDELVQAMAERIQKASERKKGGKSSWL